MDFLRTDQPQSSVHPALRNAFEALLATWVITLLTTFAVSWILTVCGYPAALAETLLEAHRWFIPMFAYLCAMFWMIDTRLHWRAGSPRV